MSLGAVTRTFVLPLLVASRRLLAGGRTAVLSLLGVVVAGLTVAACLVGLWRLAPAATGVIRRFAQAERRRLSGYQDEPVEARYHELDGSLSKRLVSILRDPATHRDLLWMLVHGPFGLMCACLAVGLPLGVLNGLLLPFYWWAIPGGVPSSAGYVLDSWWLALASPFVGLGYGLIGRWLLPLLVRAQLRAGRALLAPRGDQLLSARVAELADSRAAALEAHGAELRRIERDLHDGTQNKLVAVAMHLGIVERALRRESTANSLPLVLQAQNATADALSGLREVIRSIYPPILGERGLDGALAALAAGCTVPCRLHIGTLRRTPAAVETAAYFAVSETLTNIAKHSGATEAAVWVETEGDDLVLRIQDDGRGGAVETPGGGLAGIRRRVTAFDGEMTLTSPDGGPTVLRLVLPAAS